MLAACSCIHSLTSNNNEGGMGECDCVCDMTLTKEAELSIFVIVNLSGCIAVNGIPDNPVCNRTQQACAGLLALRLSRAPATWA